MAEQDAYVEREALYDPRSLEGEEPPLDITSDIDRMQHELDVLSDLMTLFDRPGWERLQAHAQARLVDSFKTLAGSSTDLMEIGKARGTIEAFSWLQEMEPNTRNQYQFISDKRSKMIADQEEANRA